MGNDRSSRPAAASRYVRRPPAIMWRSPACLSGQRVGRRRRAAAGAQTRGKKGKILENRATLRKTIGGEESSTPAVMRRLWPYLKPVVWVLVLAVAAMGLSAATDAGIPALLKPLLDHGFGQHANDHAKWYVP